MNRLITHLIVSAITFSLGITSAAIFKRQYTPQVLTHEVQSTPQLLTEAPPPVKANISTPDANIVWNYDVNRFDPRGDYYFLGPKPKAFPEFDCLELAVYPSDGKAVGQVMIQIVVNRTYEAQYAVFGRVTEQRLMFSTTAGSDDQYDYAFDGYFVKDGVLSNADKNEAVAEGRLTKFKHGVLIAEARIRFRVEYLGC
jgi:hypothetical protein